MIVRMRSRNKKWRANENIPWYWMLKTGVSVKISVLFSDCHYISMNFKSQSVWNLVTVRHAFKHSCRIEVASPLNYTLNSEYVACMNVFNLQHLNSEDRDDKKMLIYKNLRQPPRIHDINRFEFPTQFFLLIQLSWYFMRFALYSNGVYIQKSFENHSIEKISIFLFSLMSIIVIFIRIVNNSSILNLLAIFDRNSSWLDRVIN